MNDSARKEPDDPITEGAENSVEYNLTFRRRVRRRTHKGENGDGEMHSWTRIMLGISVLILGLCALFVLISIFS